MLQAVEVVDRSNCIAQLRELTTYKIMHDCSNAVVARKFGYSESEVVRILSLESLCAQARKFAETHELLLEQAEKLSTLTIQRQIEFCEKIAVDGTVDLDTCLSESLPVRRESESLAYDDNTYQLVTYLSSLIDMPCSLLPDKSEGHKGRVMISYNDLDELDYLLTVLEYGVTHIGRSGK